MPRPSNRILAAVGAITAEEVTPEQAMAEDRPAGNAPQDEWASYRLRHGYSEEELEGQGRNALRDLEDR